MDIIYNPARSCWDELCLRPSSENPVVLERVQAIIARVKKDRDLAIKQLSEEIDKLTLEEIEVSEAEIAEAEAAVSEEVKAAIAKAKENIGIFHQAQMPKEISVETSEGVRCIQRPVPIAKVGLYIPGGTAPLFSTVLMLAVPAKIAGCKQLILCTPVGKSGKVAAEVLYAAKFCGVDRIFKVGGAQAVAAMAYGTETIPAVDKIFGPGNQYVTTAKQLLSNKVVAIDMPAGPSEVMVLTDKTSNPAFAAADLLSQAEHGADSQVMLVSDCKETAEAVIREVERQTELLDRGEFIRKSLSKSRFIVFDDSSKLAEFADAYGPEHLIILTEKPWNIANCITSAGSVFVGAYSPESAGDYASGTNHTLPTCAWARAFSGVNIDSFMRKMTLQDLSKKGLESLAPTIVAMAKAEGLEAHANAVKIRIAYGKK